MRKVVGFSQKTKRTWLDALLDRFVQTTDDAELRAFLDNHLKEDLPSKASRAKSAGILLRVWSSIPRQRVPLRDRAIVMLPQISGQERIWLHWGMSALAYPFFRDTAEVVGRLLALQDDFTTAQVQARMMTTWGDRATTREATQKLLTTWVDWEVLRATKRNGQFLPVRKMTASIPDLELWLLEALLAESPTEEIEAQQLLRLPESFPFTFSVGVTDLRGYDGFNIHRQGLDMDMVGLRKVKVEPPPSTPAKRSKKRKSAKADGPKLFDRLSEDVAFSNGRPGNLLVARVNAQAEGDYQDIKGERQRIEESIKGEVLQTLSERADRFLQVRGTIVVPDAPFEAPTAECVEQFRDGHYFGCIALTQAVMEAVIRHVWQIKLKKNRNQEDNFQSNLEALHKETLISGETKARLDRMWADRHSFHRLRPFEDQRKLEETALNTLKLVSDVERELFCSSHRDE